MKTMNTFKLVFLCGTLVTSSGYNTADGGRILNDLCKAKCYLKVRFLSSYLCSLFLMLAQTFYSFEIYSVCWVFFSLLPFSRSEGWGCRKGVGNAFLYFFFLNFYFDSDSFICCCIFCLLLLFMFWFNICNL